MAKKAKKQTARGRKQDRARVAGGQDYEVGYESKKTRKSAGAVKKAVKKVGQQPEEGREDPKAQTLILGRSTAKNYLFPPCRRSTDRYFNANAK